MRWQLVAHFCITHPRPMARSNRHADTPPPFPTVTNPKGNHMDLSKIVYGPGALRQNPQQIKLAKTLPLQRFGIDGFSAKNNSPQGVSRRTATREAGPTELRAEDQRRRDFLILTTCPNQSRKRSRRKLNAAHQLCKWQWPEIECARIENHRQSSSKAEIKDALRAFCRGKDPAARMPNGDRDSLLAKRQTTGIHAKTRSALRSSDTKRPRAALESPAPDPARRL